MEEKLKEFTSKQHSTGHLSQRSEAPIIGKCYLNGGVSLTDTNNMKITLGCHLSSHIVWQICWLQQR